MSSAAQAATLPWVLDAFGWVNLAAPLVLLIVGPVFAFALTLGLTSIGVGSLLPWVAPWTDVLAVAAGHAFGAALAFSGPVAGLGVRAPGLDGAAWAWAMGMVAAACWPARLLFPRRVLFMMGLAPLLMLGQGAGHEWILFDVGQGDCALALNRRSTWMIDTGPAPAGGAGYAWGPARALRWYGRRRIDLLVLTHHGEPMALVRAEAELDRRIAVLLLRALRNDLKVVKLQNRDRNVPAVIREQAGHPDFLCDHSRAQHL